MTEIIKSYFLRRDNKGKIRIATLILSEDNNIYFIQQIAKVNAKQQNYIISINNASDGYTIDNIKKDFTSYVNEVLSK